ncbi:MAG: MBL fold metallo-hydrolase, partial [Treponema sp.]|nr:MBL fold metallo-hydrolase [Treponema sp.]
MNKKINCITVGDIRTNCWLYSLDVDPAADGGEDGSCNQKPHPCVVIDPGDEADAIIARLKELDWAPRFIFLTHGHIDHLAALPDLLEAFEKGVFGSCLRPKIGVHRLDTHYMGKDSLAVHRHSFSASGGDPAFVDALWKSLPDGDLLLEEGDTAGPFRVLHTPGHSPGSAGFYDEKAGIL